MAVATVLDREYDGIVPWVAYGATAWVMAGRVAGNRHWFSDVMAGAVIGRFFGRLMTHNDVHASTRSH
jgi:membrane-associated phospholipid phosphatase